MTAALIIVGGILAMLVVLAVYLTRTSPTRTTPTRTLLDQLEAHREDSQAPANMCTRCGTTRMRLEGRHHYQYPEGTDPRMLPCRATGHEWTADPETIKRVEAEQDAERAAEQERVAAEWQRIRDELQARHEAEEP